MPKMKKEIKELLVADLLGREFFMDENLASRISGKTVPFGYMKFIVRITNAEVFLSKSNIPLDQFDGLEIQEMSHRIIQLFTEDYDYTFKLDKRVGLLVKAIRG